MTSRAGIIGLIRLIRPFNFILFFAGVALGGLLAGGLEAFSETNIDRLVMAMLSAALIGGGGNAINDFYDLATDQINRPERPLPSGLVSPKSATRLWLGLTIIGVVLGSLISPVHALLGIGSAALLWAYSARLKRRGAWGNLTVALILMLAIFYGGLVPASGKLGAVLVGAAFAFLTTLAREGAKDIEDMEGDALTGSRTLPLSRGARFAARFTLAIIFVTLLALPLPAVTGFGLAFVGFAIPAAVCLLAAGWALLAAGAPDSDASLRRGAAAASLWLKLTMVVGILALALARIG